MTSNEFLSMQQEIFQFKMTFQRLFTFFSQNSIELHIVSLRYIAYMKIKLNFIDLQRKTPCKCCWLVNLFVKPFKIQKKPPHAWNLSNSMKSKLKLMIDYLKNLSKICLLQKFRMNNARKLNINFNRYKISNKHRINIKFKRFSLHLCYGKIQIALKSFENVNHCLHIGKI